MYTLHPDDEKKKVYPDYITFNFLKSLIRILGPIAPFTADEAWSFHQSDKDLTSEVLALQAWPKSGGEFGIKEMNYLIHKQFSILRTRW